MPKVAKQLSDLQVRSLKADGVYAVGGVAGLSVRVQSRQRRQVRKPSGSHPFGFLVHQEKWGNFMVNPPLRFRKNVKVKNGDRFYYCPPARLTHSLSLQPSK